MDREPIDESQGDGDAILVSAGNITLEEVTGELEDLSEVIPREPDPVIPDDANTGHEDDPPAEPEPEEEE